MDVKQQLTIEKLIESFKLSHPSNVIAEQLSDYEKDRILNWPSIECPFFTDEEIEQLKDYYDESGTESYHDYFNENTSTIINSNHMNEPNMNTNISYSQRVIQLQDKMDNTINPYEIDNIKQNLIDIGWNPEIKYTPESQIMARERFIKLNNQKATQVDIIDIQPLIEKMDYIDNIDEVNTERLYPVSIVLVQGDSIVSKPIQNVTKCDFSHSALALNGDFNRLYSYNFANSIKLGGGFSLENIKRYPPLNRLGIYSFFVKKDNYDKLQNYIQQYLLNIKNTSYSTGGLLFFPFKNINYNSSEKMICSQFVDICLKLISVDLTNKNSSKVSPANLYNVSINNTKIYKTYDGKVKDFNQEKIKKALTQLSKTAKVINESESINIEPLITEARKANIEINDSGDVLLTNPLIDFDNEYMSSHKLLMQYDKSNNIEAMKYELSRLYYMNYILEKKLYHNKFLINKEKNMKTRARVLNDFNKYINVVLKAEPTFNFGEYYEQSPFYPHTVEIKGSTVNAIKDMLKYIL